MQAAIGLQQIKKIDQFHLDRQNNFDRLTEIFKPYEEYFHLPEAFEGSEPSWFAFLLTVKENNLFKRNHFVSHLEKHKIQTRSYFSGNILYHPGYKQFADKFTNLKQTFPIAHEVTNSSFFLGTYSGITKEKLDYVEEVVRSFFI